MDDTFISLWNKVQTHGNPSWIAQLQNQLTDALPAYLDCTESQAVELRITQQWLRTMLWQLCVSQGLVSSVAVDNTRTFKYPIEVSRDLLSMTHQFSQHAMEVHGVGLVSFAIFSLSLVALQLSARFNCFRPSSISLATPVLGIYQDLGQTAWIHLDSIRHELRD